MKFYGIIESIDNKYNQNNFVLYPPPLSKFRFYKNIINIKLLKRFFIFIWYCLIQKKFLIYLFYKWRLFSL